MTNVCYSCLKLVHPNAMTHSCNRSTGCKKSEKVYRLGNFHKLIKKIISNETDYTVLFKLQLQDFFQDSEKQRDINVKGGNCVKITHKKSMKGLKKTFHIIYSDLEPESLQMYDENDFKTMVSPENISILSDRKIKKIQHLLRKSAKIRLSPYTFEFFVVDRKYLLKWLTPKW